MYDQTIVVNALAVEGCIDEFILGLDFLRATRAIINHATCELTFEDNGAVTLPFVCRDEYTVRSRPAAERLVRRLRVGCEQQVNARVRVPGKDGDVGLFVPAKLNFRQLLVAPTLATVCAGHVTVPFMNMQGGHGSCPHATCWARVSRWTRRGQRSRSLTA